MQGLRRVVSELLAVVMCVVMCVPAFAAGDGGTRGGGTGRFDVLANYTGSSDGTNYNSGTVSNKPILDVRQDETGAWVPRQNIIYMPSNYNTTTNNYYQEINFTSYTYNQITNTFNCYTDNSQKNYYEITYAPTYTTINYVQAEQVQYTHNYYYQLPDGRNSSMLTAADVNGLRVSYQVQNYDLVMQDDKTMALYHFDGDLKDASGYNGSVSFNGSHKYVDRGSFGQGMVPGSSMFTFTTPDSFNPNEDWTLEFTFYAKASTYPAILDKDDAYETKSGSGTFYYEEGSYTGTITGDWTNYRVFTISPFIRFGSQSALSTSYLGDSGPITDYKTGDICSVKVTNNKGTYFQNGSMYYYQRKGPYAELKNETLTVGGDKNNRATTAIPSTWERFAIVRKDDMLYLYREGSRAQSWQAGTFDDNTLRIGASIATFSSFYIDELRLSKGALYTGSSYTPSSMPFDTNKALVLPSDPKEATLAVQSITPVGAYRIGGVRPTFPTKGDVYIPVTSSVAGACQQFDGADWVPVGAAIYDGTSWHEVKGYTIKDTPDPLPEPDPPPDPGGDDSSSTPTPTPPDDGGSSGIPWDRILDAIGGFFAGLGEIIAKVIEGFTSILSVFGTLVSGFASVGSSITGLMAGLMSWVPSEIINVLTFGITLIILLAVVKFMRG